MPDQCQQADLAEDWAGNHAPAQIRTIRARAGLWPTLSRKRGSVIGNDVVSLLGFRMRRRLTFWAPTCRKEKKQWL